MTISLSYSYCIMAISLLYCIMQIVMRRCRSEWRTCGKPSSRIQGYLAHKKHPPRRTLQ